MSDRGRNDVISSPTVGTSQSTATTISAMWTGERVMNATIRSLRASRLRANELGGLDGRHQATTFSLRKRRMLKTITGMIRTSITTATAAP